MRTKLARFTILVTALMSAPNCSQSSGSPARPLVLVAHDVASPGESRAPRLARARDGRPTLSWLEIDSENHAHARVRVASLDEKTWTQLGSHALGKAWIDHPTEVPSAVVLTRGELAAVWAGPAIGSYDLQFSRSVDGGAHWPKPKTVHGDGTDTEHGLASVLPWKDNSALIVWLDGRGYAGTGEAKTQQSTLRRATLDSNGEISDRGILDPRVCDCCPTAIAGDKDAAIVVYRDRSHDDQRDISFVRFANGAWSEPAPVYSDGWVMKGCPMNGPDVAMLDGRVGVVWFTAAHDKPSVLLSHSGPTEAGFSAPLRVDDGHPMGHAAIELTSDGDIIVAWVENHGSNRELRVRKVGANGSKGASHRLLLDPKSELAGVPQVLRHGQQVLFAWVDSNDGTKIRVASANLSML